MMYAHTHTQLADGAKGEQVLPSAEQLDALEVLARRLRHDEANPRMTWAEAWWLAWHLSWHRTVEPAVEKP